MRWLATFVMQGRWRAIVAAALGAVVSLAVPPVGMASSAVVALVTLRAGLQSGLTVMAGATALCAVLALAAVGTMAPVMGFLALMWMPAWLTGGALRASRSLGLVLQAALIFGLLVIAVYQLQYPDPIAEWRATLTPFADHMVASGLLPADQHGLLLDRMAPWMTGILAAVFYLQLVVALLLARWWQACLYNPGGFRAEFHGLRLHRYLAYAGLPILGLLLLPGESAGAWWVRYAGLLLLAAYLFQGLAVMHGLVARIGLGVGWLVGLYVLLLVAMPQAATALAVAGYMDAWFDFRARLRGRRGSDDGAI